MPQILIEPLKKSSHRLAEALNLPVDDIVRDATVQRFEYTFELAWKTLKRVLNQVYNLQEEAYPLILKQAAKVNLIRNPEIWMGFKQARNYTSHNYSQTGAEYSYRQAELFLPEVEDLIAKLEAVLNKIND